MRIKQSQSAYTGNHSVFINKVECTWRHPTDPDLVADDLQRFATVHLTPAQQNCKCLNGKKRKEYFFTRGRDQDEG
jgi:hypothetical protein